MKIKKLILVIFIILNAFFAYKYLIKTTTGVIASVGTQRINSYTYDYIEYWSAAKSFVNGLPVYDPLNQLKVQREVADREQAMMMWNPPWTVTLLLPVLNQPYDFSLVSWKILNVLFVLILAFLLWTPKEKSLIAGIYIASFMPLLYCFKLGQVGIFIALGVALFAVGLKTKNDLLTAIGAVIMSIKPHLFYLVWIVFAWSLYRERRYQLFRLCLILFLTLLVVTELISPNIISEWIVSVNSPHTDIAVPTSGWVGPMLPHALSLILPESWNLSHHALSVLIPGFLVILLFYCLIKERISLSIESGLLPVLLFSIWTAPFGWIFDVTVLIFPLTLWLIKKDQFVLLLFFIYQFVTTLFFEKISFHHLFWWYMPLLIGLYYYAESRSNKDAAA